MLTELITEHEGEVEHSAYTFTRDSKQLIYSTDEYGEFRQAWAYDLEHKTKKVNTTCNPWTGWIRTELVLSAVVMVDT